MEEEQNSNSKKIKNTNKLETSKKESKTMTQNKTSKKEMSQQTDENINQMETNRKKEKMQTKRNIDSNQVDITEENELQNKTDNIKNDIDENNNSEEEEEEEEFKEKLNLNATNNQIAENQNENNIDENETEEEEEEETADTNTKSNATVNQDLNINVITDNDDESEEEEEEVAEEVEEEEEEVAEEVEEEEEEEEEEAEPEEVVKPDKNQKSDRSDRSEGIEEEEAGEEEETDDSDEEKETPSKILAHKIDDNGRKIFLIKFHQKSYRHCKWLTETDLKQHNNMLYRHYIKNHPEEETDEPYFNQNFLIAEKIFSMKKKNDKTFYLVKWKDLECAESTWEDDEFCNQSCPELIEQYTKSRVPSLSRLFAPPRPNPQSFRPITHHPSSKHGYQIRQYQLSGLNFMVNSWYNNRNAILADEMGLGKTAQAIMFLDHLDKKQEVHGPFLVVAPLSTIPHWQKEIIEWSDLSSVAYFGTSANRRFLKNYEMFYPPPNSTIPMFQVLLTTYEYVIRAEKLFSPIKWRTIIIDEAQRMKNHQSKLFSSLSMYSSDFKLLMTGTPLQNNISELWTLLNFLDPNSFDNLQKFQKNFGDLNEVDNVAELQTILKPMMLRRMKSDVEKSISPLEEIIIECPMTQYQRMYYKSIFEKNIEYLQRGAHKGNSSSFNNIAMQLRKVCNHPFLIKGAESQIRIEKREALKLNEGDEDPPNFEFDLLVRNSGKMILLDKLLHKLKQDGHRVLIFSQMTQMLDIIQDYLDLSDYKFRRIDGSIRSKERQDSIDDFNKQGSDYFVFLLCTRSGGVGINLASADTVIIFDSDYNPQNDIQATSRCHRIGQKKDVKMYRFITAKSYERKLFDIASIKLGLDHAVLGGGKKDDLSKHDMEKILRFGAYYAYNDEEDGNASEIFGEEDIESVISRSTRIQHASVVGGEGSTFSTAHFEISEDETELDLTAPDFWQKYVPVVEEDQNFDHCSIAERYRKTKERMSLEDLNEKLHSSSTPSLLSLAESKEPKKRSRKKDKDEKNKDEKAWSMNKISKLVNSMLRFGWGRWKAIIEFSGLTFELRQIIAAAHVILRWLIESSKEPFPVMTSINQKCIENDSSDEEMLDMQKAFIVKYRDAFYNTVTSRPSVKLSRFELLYFIDILIKSAKNPPEDIPIPSAASSKPTDWWSVEDDKLLIYNTWKYGFSNYSNEEFKFSQNIDGEAHKKLTNRLHSLMNNLKNSFASYKMKHEDENITFSCDVLQRALRIWIPKMQRGVIDALILIGKHPDMKKFKQVGCIENKTNDDVKEFVQKILDCCDAIRQNEGVEKFHLAEPISMKRAGKILKRVSFFDDLRNTEIETKNENDRKLVDYLKENGFINMSTELEWTKEAYELPELSENNIIRLIYRIRRNINNKKMAAASRTRIRSTRSNPNFDDFNKNTKIYIEAPFLIKKEDGTYKYPIQITPKIKLISIGEVVYDRSNYHTDKYIYPVGYQIEKEFYSIEDPNNQAVYRASVLDGGSNPLFRVECLDSSKMVFEGTSPSKPWMEASLAIEASKKKFGLPTKDVVTISGPVAYGFPLPIVTYLIDNLPNAHKCENHHFKRYAIKGEPEDESDEEINNENDNANYDDDDETNEEFDDDDDDEETDDDDDDDDEENDNDNNKFGGDYYDDNNGYSDDSNGYSEEESYDDQYDGDSKKVKIRMRRIRVMKKRRDFFPSLNLKFNHWEEINDNADNNDINLTYRSNQLVRFNPFDFKPSHALNGESVEDQLRNAVIKLSEEMDQNV